MPDRLGQTLTLRQKCTHTYLVNCACKWSLSRCILQFNAAFIDIFACYYGSQMMFPGVIGCFGSQIIVRLRLGVPAKADQTMAGVCTARSSSATAFEAFSAASAAYGFPSRGPL